MKKFLIATALTLALAFSVSAQTNVPLTIKGDIDIKFNSRTTKGAKDVYTLKVNVANSALFQGTITDTPQLIDGWVSKKVTQPRSLAYDINCDVVNPKNPATILALSRLTCCRWAMRVDSQVSSAALPLASLSLAPPIGWKP
jgi:opacity protein-like surface antigen